MALPALGWCWGRVTMTVAAGMDRKLGIGVGLGSGVACVRNTATHGRKDGDPKGQCHDKGARTTVPNFTDSLIVPPRRSVRLVTRKSRTERENILPRRTQRLNKRTPGAHPQNGGSQGMVLQGRESDEKRRVLSNKGRIEELQHHRRSMNWPRGSELGG